MRRTPHRKEVIKSVEEIAAQVSAGDFVQDILIVSVLLCMNPRIAVISIGAMAILSILPRLFTNAQVINAQFLNCLLLVCCTIDISHNCLPKFPSAALSSVNDAAASPPSFALQTENLFCVIMLKMNVSAH